MGQNSTHVCLLPGLSYSHGAKEQRPPPCRPATGWGSTAGLLPLGTAGHKEGSGQRWGRANPHHTQVRTRRFTPATVQAPPMVHAKGRGGRGYPGMLPLALLCHS